MPRTSSKFTDKGFEKILKDLRDVSKKVIKVGLFSEDRSSDNQYNMAQLGSIQEYGLPSKNIPARPFMMDTALYFQVDIADDMAKLAGNLIDGEIDVNAVHDKIGETYADYTRDTIDNGDFEDNNWKTIKIKNSEDPLIHTKKMYKSIKHKVVNK